MSKKSARRSRRKGFVAIPFSVSLALLTLADDTVLLGDFVPTLLEDLFVISVDGEWVLDGMTPGEGPVEVGIAHGDYTDAEVEECLSAELNDPDNLILAERARRKIRRVGSFWVQSANEALGDGRTIRTKCRFMVGDGHTLAFFAANRSSAALTTAGSLNIQGTIYGRWVR